MSAWQPTATIANLKKRAEIFKKIRAFFDVRGVLEVETPLLSHTTVTDPYVIGIPAVFREAGSSKEKTVYLQTSPEYAMKRLLAAGSGPIYQLTKAFRQGEMGSYHNPEFTMLEWYRPGFDHHALMDEMDALLQDILSIGKAERFSYATAFEKFVGINPHFAKVDELKQCIVKKNMAISFAEDNTNKNFWLDFLMTHCVEPHLGKDVPTFLYDFPMTQAALAKIRFDENPAVASRFEVYFKGVELANGFHELQDAKEQRKRFEEELKARIEKGLMAVSIDEYFLAALDQGIPDCSGVAVGIDRLVMLAMKSKSVRDVMSFAFDVA